MFLCAAPDPSTAFFSLFCASCSPSPLKSDARASCGCAKNRWPSDSWRLNSAPPRYSSRSSAIAASRCQMQRYRRRQQRSHRHPLRSCHRRSASSSCVRSRCNCNAVRNGERNGGKSRAQSSESRGKVEPRETQLREAKAVLNCLPCCVNCVRGPRALTLELPCCHFKNSTRLQRTSAEAVLPVRLFPVAMKTRRDNVIGNATEMTVHRAKTEQRQAKEKG